MLTSGAVVLRLRSAAGGTKGGRTSPVVDRTASLTLPQEFPHALPLRDAVPAAAAVEAPTPKTLLPPWAFPSATMVG